MSSQLDRMVGETRRQHCDGKCKKVTEHDFCRESHVFANNKYYWKCSVCGKKQFVSK